MMIAVEEKKGERWGKHYIHIVTGHASRLTNGTIKSRTRVRKLLDYVFLQADAFLYLLAAHGAALSQRPRDRRASHNPRD